MACSLKFAYTHARTRARAGGAGGEELARARVFTQCNFGIVSILVPIPN